MVGLTFVSALPPLWQSVWNELFVEFPTCLELGSLSARSTLFPTNLEGHPSTVSGRKFPWRCVCVFCFPKKTSVEAQKTCKYMYVYTYAYVCIYVYGYFRLIRAQTERFDLRYDSEVWFGGMIRGMIRGYDSRPRKPSYPAQAGNWALSLSFTGPLLPTELTWLWPPWADRHASGMVRVRFGYGSGMIRVWFGHDS